MLPILLIHGYSSEGKDNTVAKIYGDLPKDLKQLFGKDSIKSLNLSRWISLSDGVSIDDVSYAMDRALKAEFSDLLESGFHVIIHSTGALVVRNWIRLFSPKPSPIQNLIHLAGANFGSGLAHVGQGQINRWKNLLSQGTTVGTKILESLEFGCSKTLDLHRYFLMPNQDMYLDYQVQEYNIIGSQTQSLLKAVPIRYVKEDSSDNTVRTSAGNLNFNYIPVKPTAKAYAMSPKKLASLVKKRLCNTQITEKLYDYELSFLSQNRQEIPYAVVYETAHFGDDIGIVSGSKNRTSILHLIKIALSTDQNPKAYQSAITKFAAANSKTFTKAANLKWKITEWDPQAQYEGHAQLIFRVRDQFGNGVKHFDVMFNSEKANNDQRQLESMIEDRHTNCQDDGIITFYLRTQSYNVQTKQFDDLIEKLVPLDIEITGHEADSEDIAFVPLDIQLTSSQIQTILQSFRTTIIDIVLARLPSNNVFDINKM